MEIILTHYDGLEYYIRLDVDKKNKLCYLRSYNCDLLSDFNKKWVNQEVLNYLFVNDILALLEYHHPPKEFNTLTREDGTVKITINGNHDTYKYSFNYFLPIELSFLQSILSTLISNLPGRLSELYFELCAGINGNTEKYLYNKPFKFDINKGDLTKIFNKDIVDLGEQYYKENRVRFVEFINNSYYAVVHGDQGKLQSVIINYDKKKKIITLDCNCNCFYRCEHIYATLKHIQKKELYKFYKLLYLDNNTDQMFDKLFSNLTYLCVGVDGNKIILMMPNGELNAVNACDPDGNLLFKVIEDDENHTLEKELDKIKELD